MHKIKYLKNFKQVMIEIKQNEIYVEEAWIISVVIFLQGTN
jgi:hypothetical protein